MAGCSAMIRHDSGSALHDRNPVGIGRLGDQNRAVLEIRYVGGAADHAGPARRNRASDRGPRGEDLPLLLQPIVPESGGAARRLHRLRPRLEAVKLPGLAMLPPFHVHRAAVVLLDRSEEHTSELQSLMRLSYAVFFLKK